MGPTISANPDVFGIVTRGAREVSIFSYETGDVLRKLFSAKKLANKIFESTE
jgi:hypothetical protein